MSSSYVWVAAESVRATAFLASGPSQGSTTQFSRARGLPMFMYLGRRGSLGRFTLELAQAARSIEEMPTSFAVSNMNEVVGDLDRLGISLLTIDTFDRAASLALASNFFSAKRRLLHHLEAEKASVVINLMPHVWTPLLRGAIQQLGIRYVSVIHDAVKHRGDRTGYLTRWLRSEAYHADLVVTLSRTVADRLITLGIANGVKIHTVFHPDLTYGCALANRVRDPSAQLKLLFFGRILKYKGLSHLVDAIEMLRAEGLHVHLGVAGAGDLNGQRRRLAQLGAEVINRWLDDTEVGPLLARYDAIVLPHIEASQSGVAATAFGNCMPVVGMPAGGIAEQIVDGRTGVLAHQINARALADAIRRLADDPALYNTISAHLTTTAEDRSMGRFLGEILDEVSRRWA